MYLIHNDWKQYLNIEFKKKYFLELEKFITKEYQEYSCYPKQENIFKAFEYCSFQQTKVVLIGQDPYHGENQANGLSFSVPKGIKQPPSLKNIFKALNNDLELDIPEHGDLSNWAKQGVLMLNATLSVRASEAGSHQKKGWEIFTDTIINTLSNEKENLVFLLWGSYAQQKTALIDTEKHLILTSVHPSPLSAYRGFLECKHFSQTNQYLHQKGIKPIDWVL